ncbi:hypothetical protein NLG97_g2771 [Lecanicillium saksenae]|uniref:Uncharacterized protein n=1 Tax=Lecanicillium saksenae TaxID=468837 RepID=A0ACC1R1V2_9HYPO|nr:hypothetical protein NLG97_g2771 [Lecanicillium saksenae]
MTCSGTQSPTWAFDVVDACNKFDGNLDGMWKFCLLNNSTPVGYMTEEFANQMDWTGTAFNVCKLQKRVHLNPALLPGDDGTESCNLELIKLCEINRSRFNGCFENWLWTKNCFHAIRWLDNRKPIFRMPTPLRGILGIATAGVHFNVYTIIGDQPFMWIARRSRSTTYPGMLDQIVAGAMDPKDTSPWSTLQHEAWDEAGLVLDVHSANVTHNDLPVGTVYGPSRISFYDKKDRSVGLEVGHLEPGVRFVFEMEVPPTFVPKPGTSDAVGGFILKSVAEVKKDLSEGKWKPNSGLTTLDFLVRKGYIADGGDGTVERLQAALQRKLPMPTR